MAANRLWPCVAPRYGDTEVESIRRFWIRLRPLQCGSTDCLAAEVGSIQHRNIVQTRRTLRCIAVANPAIGRLNPSFPTQNVNLVSRTPIDRGYRRVERKDDLPT